VKIIKRSVGERKMEPRKIKKADAKDFMEGDEYCRLYYKTNQLVFGTSKSKIFFEDYCFNWGVGPSCRCYWRREHQTRYVLREYRRSIGHLRSTG
jgi:hypothetical protein